MNKQDEANECLTPPYFTNKNYISLFCKNLCDNLKFLYFINFYSRKIAVVPGN